MQKIRLLSQKVTLQYPSLNGGILGFLRPSGQNPEDPPNSTKKDNFINRGILGLF